MERISIDRQGIADIIAETVPAQRLAAVCRP
jgi:hypothetical protein